jgi:hypothetical protein
MRHSVPDQHVTSGPRPRPRLLDHPWLAADPTLGLEREPTSLDVPLVLFMFWRGGAGIGVQGTGQIGVKEVLSRLHGYA